MYDAKVILYKLQLLFIHCREDRTQMGYVLETPKKRGFAPILERNLSPAASAIMRVLMHCALLWASSQSEVTEEHNDSKN